MRQCYDRARANRALPEQGQILFTVQVLASGEVKDVSTRNAAELDGVARCMTEGVRRFRFQPADADYQVDFPVVVGRQAETVADAAPPP
jgi:hypothetical protein